MGAFSAQQKLGLILDLLFHQLFGFPSRVTLCRNFGDEMGRLVLYVTEFLEK
jgi:hypothetical protein